MATLRSDCPRTWPIPSPANRQVPREKTVAGAPGTGAPRRVGQWPKQEPGRLWPHVGARRHQSSAALQRRADTRWPRSSPAKGAHGNRPRPAHRRRGVQTVAAKNPVPPGKGPRLAAAATRPIRHQRLPQQGQRPTSIDGEAWASQMGSCRHFQASAAKMRLSAAISPRGLRPCASSTSAPRRSCAS